MPGKYFTLVKTLNVCYEKHDCLLYYTKIRYKFISFINLELLSPLVIFPNTGKGINVNNMLLRTRFTVQNTNHRQYLQCGRL